MSTTRQLARRRTSDPTIHYALHDAGTESKACVLLTHGYGEHSGRYHHVVEAWNERGITVASYDLRGHGLSGGARGHILSFSEYLRDGMDLLDALRVEPAWTRCGTPLLFGHSLGGLIAFHQAAAHPKTFRGLLLSSPFFGLALKVPAAKRLAGQLFSRLLPTLSLPTGMKGSDVTRDPVVADAYDRDPLVGHNATARWFTEAQQAQIDATVLAPDFRLPIFCLQGAADKVASAQASKAILDRVASHDRTYVAVEGAYHEVLNDPGKEQLVAQLADHMLAWRSP